MADLKKEKELIENSKTLSDSKKKEMKANLEQQKEIDNDDRAQSDVYAKTEGKDPETGVEIPTEESVEEAKDWVDNQNRR
ncbi:MULTISPECIES: DUF3787 domain-containing protein [Peptoniphilus]|jgi:hypothetical protein|uniref:CDIF630_02480 family spore surface protein n=1 Tax=Peptoniphilus TaxID=162289 RepID=UPI000289FBD0|nr:MULTISPECIES: DUF3787 domain-containing protein [Peptoniphilus]MBS6610415.1 DUF3787 domain-containing protein [Peptoniphilus harei]MDU1043109.1 DUF3787 domain-containing protein [Peptoniphilus rhinitidis]MDU1955127.1 DUF3787 domain-containing protein [Peptoniphilus lacydonensis]MDU2109727.1 DUF3787 domain-containing protein [Peptoniphilus lacydonensis]MDU2114842.1 DUF3787 domain-containing protein [Peptoniphilus lacydonensis]